MNDTKRIAQYTLFFGGYMFFVKNPLFGQLKISGKMQQAEIDKIIERVKKTSSWELRQLRKNYPNVVFEDTIYQVRINDQTLFHQKWQLATMIRCFKTELPTHYVKLQKIINQPNVPEVVQLPISHEEWQMLTSTEQNKQI